jgi:hypothetical protein
MTRLHRITIGIVVAAGFATSSSPAFAWISDINASGSYVPAGSVTMHNPDGATVHNPGGATVHNQRKHRGHQRPSVGSAGRSICGDGRTPLRQERCEF